MQKTYTREEVHEIIEPLIKQIEFYHDQYSKCRRFIILPWYKTVFLKWSFIKSLWKDEDESDTLIENLYRYRKQNPEMFEFLKSWYDVRSPRNN